MFWSGSGSYPVVGDWDGNGSDGVGVKNGTSRLLNNQSDAGSSELSFEYGAANDLPLTRRQADPVAPPCETLLAQRATFNAQINALIAAVTKLNLTSEQKATIIAQFETLRAQGNAQFDALLAGAGCAQAT